MYDLIFEEIELDRGGSTFILGVHYYRSPCGTVFIDKVYWDNQSFRLTKEELVDLLDTLKEPL